MTQYVLVSEESDVGVYHLPANDSATDPDAACGRIDAAAAETISAIRARREGYTRVCAHCRTARNRTERTATRESTLPSPQDAVDRVRRLREGSHE
jgi:hypothetical protein